MRRPPVQSGEEMDRSFLARGDRMGGAENVVQRRRRGRLRSEQRAVGRGTGTGVEVAGDDAGHGAGDVGDPIAQQLRRLRARPRAVGVEVRIEPVKGRTAGARPELHPSDHARIDLGPPAAARLLGSLAEPEISAIEQLETGGLEKHAAHFAALFPIVATDAAEGVIAELLTQIGFHRVQTFLRAEQVGVKGADALHDKVASLVPDIVPVEDRADAEVEGHHAEFVRGSEFGNLRCGDRPVVSGATARQDEREAGQGDSPGQRFGLHRLFFLTSARCARNQSPVG